MTPISNGSPSAISNCRSIWRVLRLLFRLLSPKRNPKEKVKPAKNAPRFELGRELQRITGVDLTRIDGIDVMVA